MYTQILLLLLLLLPCLLFPSSTSALYLSSYVYPYTPQDGLPKGVFYHAFSLFGPDPLTYNVTANITFLDDNPTLCLPIQQPNMLADKIVLARRDPACDFLSRARTAEENGAMGLIIFDYKNTRTFEVQFMGPYLDPPAVHIPVIFVLSNVGQELQASDTTGKPHWATTTATIDPRGLIADLEDYFATQSAGGKYTGWMRTLIILSPLLIVMYSYYQFYVIVRDNRSADGRQAAGAPAIVPPPPPVVAVPAVVVSQPPSDAPLGERAEDNVVRGGRSAVASSSHFSENEMNQLSLPVPPHLSSGDTQVAGQHASSSSSSVSLENVELRELTSLHTSRNTPRSAGQDESEGSLLGNNQLHRSDMEHGDVATPSAHVAPNRALVRPLLPVPIIPMHLRFYYHVLKGLSSIGKPYWILRLNGFIYIMHIIMGIGVLISGWNETCANSNQTLVSLWIARAFIGFRICYWQTHSSSTPVPGCIDIFFKNWTDCIYLFTGSISTWSEEQKTDCELNAPIIYHWIQFWTILMYCTYGGRILLYLFDWLSQRHQASLPHLFSIGSHSFLCVSQGGFSCAGALDKNQPATQLDLMLIPTVSFHEGMYSAEDAVCGVCLGEYSNGEVLRILNCTHHFHQGCVDTWLLQRNTCPTCRSSIDQTPSNNARRSVDVSSAVHNAPSVLNHPPSPSRVHASHNAEDEYHPDEDRVPNHPYFAAPRPPPSSI